MDVTQLTGLLLCRELAAFPGPLKPGVTHKNDVIKFCERKIAASRNRADIADRESYILLWEMLILMLRQKGQVTSTGNFFLSSIFFAQVEGSDLADLLLRDSPEQGDHLHTGQVHLQTFS